MEHCDETEDVYFFDGELGINTSYIPDGDFGACMYLTPDQARELAAALLEWADS